MCIRVRLMPLVITDEQFSEGLAILEESIEAILVTDRSEFGNE